MGGEKDRYRLDGVLAVEREMADGPGPVGKANAQEVWPSVFSLIDNL